MRVINILLDALILVLKQIFLSKDDHRVQGFTIYRAKKTRYLR